MEGFSINRLTIFFKQTLFIRKTNRCVATRCQALGVSRKTAVAVAQLSEDSR
jgi:hypothetical protein